MRVTLSYATGLSPRVRGNPAIRNTRTSARSIPARTGEPIAALSKSRSIPARTGEPDSANVRGRVYPRAYGGTPSRAGRHRSARGGASRVRGNPSQPRPFKGYSLHLSVVQIGLHSKVWRAPSGSTRFDRRSEPCAHSPIWSSGPGEEPRHHASETDDLTFFIEAVVVPKSAAPGDLVQTVSESVGFLVVVGLLETLRRDVYVVLSRA